MQQYVVLTHPHLGLGLFLNHVYTAKELFRRCEGCAQTEKDLEDILFDNGRHHFRAVHKTLPFFQPPKLRSAPKHNKGREGEEIAEEPAKKRICKGDYREWRGGFMEEDVNPLDLIGSPSNGGW